MTVSTRSLDKIRPPELKSNRDVDGYFRELERLLALIGGTEFVGSTGGVSGNFAALSAQLNGALSRLSSGVNLTCDCASLTADNYYITADIA